MADRISYGPFTLYESEAYKRGKQLEGTKKALEVEEKLLDIQKKRAESEQAMRETPEGRVGQAEMLGTLLERSRQQREGIQIGPEIGAAATAAGGPNLLEASQMQGDLLVRERARQMREAAMENMLAGGQGIVPTAKVDVGGITQTVPAMQAAQTGAQVLQQVFNANVPIITAGYIARGYDPETARKLAMEDEMSSLMKAQRSGKITVLAADGTTSKTYSDSEARMALKDPDVPETIKEQLRAFVGPEKRATAPSWINTRLGR